MVGNVLTQSLAIVDALHPLSQTNATVNGAAVDMLFFHRIMYVCDVGVFGSSATVDFKLQCSDTSAFSTANNLSGKAITQLLAGGGNNKMVKVGAQAEDLASSGFTNQQRYIRYVLVVGVAATLINVIGFASIGRWKAEGGVSGAAGVASGKEIAAVAQTISDAT